jgi:hypothetical protein
MAIFSTCRKCGRKAVIVVVVGALLHAAVHHQDICLREQPNGPALYCTKIVAEPVHTREHGPSNPPISIGWVKVMSPSSGTSPTISIGGTSSSDSGPGST